MSLWDLFSSCEAPGQLSDRSSGVHLFGFEPVSVFPLMMLFDYCVKGTVACSVLKDLRRSVLSCGLQCVGGVSGTV